MIGELPAGASIRAGDRLPERDRTFTGIDLMAYGAATWDWHRAHWDQDHARALGSPAPFVDGQMWGAVLARELVDHFGPAWFITRMELRYHDLVLAGDAVKLSGTVADVGSDGRVVVEQVVRRGATTVTSCRTELQRRRLGA